LDKLKNLKIIGKDIDRIRKIIELLHWDQETYMPRGGVVERAEQIAYLTELLHKKSISNLVKKEFDKLNIDSVADTDNNDFSIADKAFLRKFYRDYSNSVKLPNTLVADLARETSLAQNKWIEAKKLNDFKIFAPYLKKIISLLREKSEKLGYDKHPYDPLLDEYEPYMTTDKIREVFEPLKKDLTDIVKKIEKSEQVNTNFLLQNFNKKKQDELGRIIIKDMGYPMTRGRLDLTAHPFTITLGRNDVRITTRYSEKSLLSGIFSDIHEAGHALYELGFSDNIQNNILATGTSLGIHESQSRLWENQIGRSYAFWEYYFPKMQSVFKNQFESITSSDFYRAVNRVKPSLIRVEADEVTYNLHIIIRFELETDLITGKLKVENLPEKWNEMSENYLGVIPNKDGEGVLQDVHWSAGLIGYFPTYAIGNIYAAQFHKKMQADIKDMDKQISNGMFSEILQWLRDNIHTHGSIFTAEELCKKVTGESLNSTHYLNYINKKYKEIYKF